MKNIEYKVLLGDKTISEDKLKEIQAVFKEILEQKDIYFNCTNGRLKLRFINNKNAELIFYERVDSENSKISDYEIFETDVNSANIILKILSSSLGYNAEIEKKENYGYAGIPEYI